MGYLPPPPHFLSLSFSLVLSHTAHPKSKQGIFAAEMKGLGKNAQSKSFLSSQKKPKKTVLPVSDRKASCQELFSTGYLQK